ncbi:MAG: FkbM family methyltransferase [Gemmatimonadetes bacterium]|nr:FkbM family methyltransferase [Gemmatimonadota bacterium]
MFARAWKPWYVWRPHQLVLSVTRRLSALPAGDRALPVAWGGAILADPAKDVGRSIWTTGIFDLAVSEVLARLTERGDTVVDAGANVGYMTVLGATVAGPSGRVFAFEPHPGLFAVLQRNVAAAAGAASCVLKNAALGAAPGRARLVVPAGMAGNDGLAHIDRGDAVSGESVDVAVTTIDETIGDESIGVLKLDVEGYEAEVLTGAARALGRRAIRHVVFEDHDGLGSLVMRRLASAGYAIYAIGWSVGRLRLRDVREGALSHAYEAPSYLATLRPAEALPRCASAGWRVLRRLTPVS